MPADELECLGRYIAESRKECRLSQQQLAEELHLSLKTIQKLEHGRANPRYSVLAPVVKRLGISGNTVFFGQDDMGDAEAQQMIGKYSACNEVNKQILFHTFMALAEQLLLRQVPEGGAEIEETSLQ